MGYLYRSVCYPTIDLARKEVCAGAPATWATGATVYTSSCTTTDFDQPTYDLSVSADGAPGVARVLSYPSFPDCDHADAYADMASIWSAGVAALVAVLVVRWLYNRFAPSRRADDPL